MDPQGHWARAGRPPSEDEASATPADERAAPPGLSVVVPCCNEQEVLPELHRRVTAACEATGRDHELVLVNDGSSDGTWATMLGLAEADPRVVLVNLSRNYGHQVALSAGLHHCRGDRILILDADLQDPPELLPELDRKLDEGADVAYGRRRRRAGESRFKTLTASLFYRMIGLLTDHPIPPDTGDFRLMSRRVLEVLEAMPERRRFIRGMVSWVGFRQEAVEYDRSPRLRGVTKYTLRKMVRFAIDAITGFSTRPLALATWAGLASLGASGLMLAGWVAGALLGGHLSGWFALALATTLVGGFQLLALGVMGEYLGRMYEESQGRPLFVVERVVRSADASRGARPAAPGPPHEPGSRWRRVG